MTRSSARVSPRSVIRVAAISATTASSVVAVERDRAGARHVADGAVAHRFLKRLLAVDQLDDGRCARTTSRRGGTPGADARSRSTGPQASRCGCTARRRARSSWRSGTRGRARPCGSARCTATTARGAGAWGPTGRTRPGTRTRAPWRERALRRGGRRRTQRRSRAPRSRRAASSSAAGCATRADRSPRPPGPCRSTPGRWPRSAARRAASTSRSRNSITSGKLWPVSTCMIGNGNFAGRNAFSARRSSTIESLPPLNSSTGSLELGRHLPEDVDRLGLERCRGAIARSAAGSSERLTSRGAVGFGGHHVDPTFQLVLAGPPSLTAFTGLGARGAADRSVALIVQRVVWEVVLVDVAPEVLLVPVGQRVELPDVRADRRARAWPRSPGSAPALGGCR